MSSAVTSSVETRDRTGLERDNRVLEKQRVRAESGEEITETTDHVGSNNHGGNNTVQVDGGVRDGSATRLIRELDDEKTIGVKEPASFDVIALDETEALTEGG